MRATKFGPSPDDGAQACAGPGLDALDLRLLDDFQRAFPLCERPFAAIAERLGCEAGEVTARLEALERRSVVSRVGPVFAPGRIGASTLAAMAAPPERIESVAGCVNRFPAVNHNYEREHELNLWFVVAAPSARERDETLAAIGLRTGLEVLDLRLERAYHIDLGFPLWPRRPAVPRIPAAGAPSGAGANPPAGAARFDARDRRLVGAIQDGLPLVPRPFAVVGERAGLSEAEVLRRIGRLLLEGVIKRIGVVVRHHELGFRANAMVVFDAPDAAVDALGERLARVGPVTLCYRRTRRPPLWPYNLYCMLHGRERAEVTNQAKNLLPAALGGLPRAILFSRRRFRQRGARYAPADGARAEVPASG